MMCVDNFTSKSWSVRNASLQLFGSVVPRMVGQKKVRDDDSVQNSLTVADFLARYRDIVPALLDKLAGPSVAAEKTFKANPQLVPLLEMMAR